jgi:hypothetical protein
MLVGGHKLAPWHHADHGKVYGNIDHCNGNHTNDHRAWNGSSRFPNFIADITNIVIPEIVEDTNARGRT